MECCHALSLSFCSNATCLSLDTLNGASSLSHNMKLKVTLRVFFCLNICFSFSFSSLFLCLLWRGWILKETETRLTLDDTSTCSQIDICSKPFP